MWRFVEGDGMLTRHVTALDCMMSCCLAMIGGLSTCHIVVIDGMLARVTVIDGMLAHATVIDGMFAHVTND